MDQREPTASHTELSSHPGHSVSCRKPGLCGRGAQGKAFPQQAHSNPQLTVKKEEHSMN